MNMKIHESELARESQFAFIKDTVKKLIYAIDSHS